MGKLHEHIKAKKKFQPQNRPRRPRKVVIRTFRIFGFPTQKMLGVPLGTTQTW